MRVLGLFLGMALAMALVAVGFAHADVDQAGTTAANFLSVGAGARVLSMGGATLGLGDELAAISWNPAALGWAGHTEFQLSHAGLENETNQDWAAFGGRFGESSTRWAITGLYQSDGSFEGRDASNNPTGSFSASSMAFGAQIAHQFARSITVGLGAKSVMERLGDVSGFGFTFDGGVMFRSGMFGAGLAAQNVGGQMKYENLIYPFPANYGAGLSFTHPSGVKLAVDANFPKAYYSDVRAGVEYLYNDMIAIRAGYRHEMSDQTDALSGPTFGMGAGMGGLWLDYGYLISSSGEGQHRLGLKLVPGRWGMSGSLPAFAVRDEPRTDQSELRAVRSREKSAEKAAVIAATNKAKADKAAAKLAADQAKADSEKTRAEKEAAEKAQRDEAEAAKANALAAEKARIEKIAADKIAAEKAAAETAAQAAQAPKAVPAPTASTVEPSAPAPVVSNHAAPRPKKITVRKGETLKVIARRFRTSVPAIMMENNMVRDEVYEGMTLLLPREEE